MNADGLFESRLSEVSALQSGHNDDSDDEEEEFNYPDETEGDLRRVAEMHTEESGKDEIDAHEDSDDEFRYPGDSPITERPPSPPLSLRDDRAAHRSPSPPPEPRVVRPTPAQLEALYAAALSGDMIMLKKLVSNSTSSGEIEAFALVNDASPRTGLTVVHATASRGHLGALRWRT